MSNVVYLAASTDAVDASLVTKDEAVKAIASEYNIPLEKIGAIGDSTSDLPFLKIPGLGLRGAPANAQAAMKQTLKCLDNTVFLDKSILGGFLDFYQIARKKGISHIFADKDGVLMWKGQTPNETRKLRDIFEEMGTNGKPWVFVLTGSSYDQNLDFIRSCGIDRNAVRNPRLRENPFVILAENGTLQINLLTGESRQYQKTLDPNLLDLLKGPFEHQVMVLVERDVMPHFRLTWSTDRADQKQKLYVPDKKTMVTVNLPRAFADGRDYTTSPEAEELRQAILSSMSQAAQSLGLPYRVLGGA